ncbi:MAG: hypothetical protein JW996_04785 [Candidatus Cloacimonetes bacterium]|nr:hypothetical protein [Candidatus Cloacimonadota bacterium]
MTEYRYKKNFIDQEKTFQLSDDRLIIHSEDQHEEINYSDLKMLILRYSSSRYRRRQFRCTLVTEAGRQIEFTDKYYNSIGKFYDQSEEYRFFVEEMHDRMIKNNPDIICWGGMRVMNYYFSLIISLLLQLFLLILLVSLLGPIGIIPVIFFVWRLSLFYYRNKPELYHPSAIPERLLPESR